jgi:hypothetical protein
MWESPKKADRRTASVAEPQRGSLDDAEHPHGFRGVPMIGAQEERIRPLLQDVRDPGDRTGRAKLFDQKTEGAQGFAFVYGLRSHGASLGGVQEPSALEHANISI